MNPSRSLLFLICIAAFSCSNSRQDLITNPIHEGHYADPSVLMYRDTIYVYATIDPWGGDSLAVLVSRDLVQWDTHRLNWPTKKACISPTSNDSRVWAPSVVRAADDSFYIYVSVGSEVWVGASHHPLGPWNNAKADSTPLIPGNLLPGYHMIDAECFIDTDGQAYLYWGSGWNWVNGRCFAVRLHDDMVTFAGEIHDVTPPKYFEAPFMIKRDNIYYLMYSDGKVIDDSYKIRYATGKTPYGPWKEGTNSPILSTTPDSSTYAPGHHAVFRVGSQDYILYHRRSVDELKKSDVLMRQLCIDSLNFDARGAIQKVRTSGVANFVNR